MEYRPLGSSGLTVSTLSLGTVALGIPYGFIPDAPETGTAEQEPPPSLSESIQLIHKAIDSGINFIDTARGYGRSEEVLGQALHDRRHKVILATKVSGYDAQGQLLRGEAIRHHMEASLATSLRLLRTDYVDLLMLHSAPVELLQVEEAIDQLFRFQQRGKFHRLTRQFVLLWLPAVSDTLLRNCLAFRISYMTVPVLDISLYVLV